MSEDSSIENVSDTALWVATFRARETERPDALFRDPLASVLIGERGPRIANSMPYSKITAWIMATRTVAIDQLVFDAIAEGVDTVVNLGTGLDTRPYRLELPSTLKWVEIDFPHIINLKNEKLRNEKPKCQLERIALDFSDQAAVSRVYKEVGSKTNKALIITEGVIPYLDKNQAAELAKLLRSIPSFQYWIQDYRSGHQAMRNSRRLQRHLKNAPFKFDEVDPFGFFGKFGWTVKKDINGVEEGERLGRPFPFPFPANFIVKLIPKKKMEPFRKSIGYVLFKAN